MWIDRDNETVGAIGFRVETCDENHGGASRWRMQSDPAYTNQSLEPRLTGWCGTYNNVATFARGVVRVTKVNAAGTRIRVEPLTGKELADALEELGYPELAPEVGEAAG